MASGRMTATLEESAGLSAAGAHAATSTAEIDSHRFKRAERARASMESHYRKRRLALVLLPNIDMPSRTLVASVLALGCCALAAAQGPPSVLPATASKSLAQSLQAAAGRGDHLWRARVPLNADGTVNAYVEIARGDRRKWEFDMAAHARKIDRTLPEDVGGYPVNYGFVPQTVSYDGDPFDALVLGPALPDGQFVRGVIVGLMQMEDEKGLDSKVVLSRIDSAGRPLDRLTADRQREIGEYFQRYKRHESGKFSAVPGWGSAADGLAFVERTHAFFTRCRERPADDCAITP
jgi:inorganic pyrophosphatase